MDDDKKKMSEKEEEEKILRAVERDLRDEQEGLVRESRLSELLTVLEETREKRETMRVRNEEKAASLNINRMNGTDELLSLLEEAKRTPDREGEWKRRRKSDQDTEPRKKQKKIVITQGNRWKIAPFFIVHDMISDVVPQESVLVPQEDIKENYWDEYISSAEKESKVWSKMLRLCREMVEDKGEDVELEVWDVETATPAVNRRRNRSGEVSGRAKCIPPGILVKSLLGPDTFFAEFSKHETEDSVKMLFRPRANAANWYQYAFVLRNGSKNVALGIVNKSKFDKNRHALFLGKEKGMTSKSVHHETVLGVEGIFIREEVSKKQKVRSGIVNKLLSFVFSYMSVPSVFTGVLVNMSNLSVGVAPVLTKKWGFSQALSSLDGVHLPEHLRFPRIVSMTGDLLFREYPSPTFISDRMANDTDFIDNNL